MLTLATPLRHDADAAASAISRLPQRAERLYARAAIIDAAAITFYAIYITPLRHTMLPRYAATRLAATPLPMLPPCC